MRIFISKFKEQKDGKVIYSLVFRVINGGKDKTLLQISDEGEINECPPKMVDQIVKLINEPKNTKNSQGRKPRES